MPKRVLICCAVCFLALAAYQLGATRAVSAQSGAQIEAGLPFYCAGDCSAAILNRRLYRIGDGQPVPTAAIPGTQAVVGMGQVSHGDLAVILVNGDVYKASNGSWVYLGNPVSGATPVPTESGTWGQLKVRYR